MLSRDTPERLQEILVTEERKIQHYVSITGVAKLVRDRKKIEELWKPEFKMWFPEGKDDPEVALLRINLEKAEYWDSLSSTVAYALSFVSSLVTGKQPDFGENKKLDFNSEL